MTKLFIDTEFNGFGGELISFALVADDGEEFYEVLPPPQRKYNEWVYFNVVPYLEKDPVDANVFHKKLFDFLWKYTTIEVVADWPDDLSWFCRALITGPGTALNTPPLTLTLDRTLSSADSKVPHNALHDARAIKDHYYASYPSSTAT